MVDNPHEDPYEEPLDAIPTNDDGTFQPEDGEPHDPSSAPLPSRLCRYCPHIEHDPSVDVCVECGKSLIPNCIICGYDLAGLPVEGTCPECGTAIERSYRPDRLENRSTAYLEQLRTGLSFVLNAILGSVIFMVVSILSILWSTAMSLRGSFILSGNAFAILSQIVSLLFSFAMLYGWWKITTPDVQTHSSDLDSKPRQILRASVIILACIYTLRMLLSFGVPGSARFGANAFGSHAGIVLIAIGIWFVPKAAWIAKFFAAMLYVRWLASLVPDDDLATKAKRFMWLGPLLYTVGSLCIGIGPLIALILYWNILYSLKKHIVRIIDEMDHPIELAV